MLLDDRAHVVVIAEYQRKHGVAVASRDSIGAQVVEHRLAMDEPEGGAAQCLRLPDRARLGGHGTHQPLVLGFPVVVEARVIEHALGGEPLRRMPFTGDVGNARFRLFHQARAADSPIPHDLPRTDIETVLAGGRP